MQFAIADAKGRFAELIRRAEAGENSVLTRDGKEAVARLTGAPQAQDLPLFGALKGRIHFAGNFEDLPEDAKGGA
jgi:prevent-host-death family protein